jgi:hypothetical protein
LKTMDMTEASCHGHLIGMAGDYLHPPSINVD